MIKKIKPLQMKEMMRAGMMHKMPKAERDRMKKEMQGKTRVK